MTARVPINIETSVRWSRVSGRWVCRVVGWGLQDAGRYGSLWSLDLPLPDTTERDTARDLLRVLAAELLRAVGTAD